MSDYGLLQEVRIVYRGSTLTTAAAVSDTELVVEYAGDFSYDPDDPDDTGGTLDLNGVRLAYSSILFGELVDDPDTIILTDPVTVAADVDDFVGAVAGGQVLEDWVAYVTMGEGDAVVVPLSVDQRGQWPVGVYPDPVPVVISDDLLHLEDAPGRTTGGRTAFWNTDTATAEGPGDVALNLTWVPVDASLHVRWNGLSLPSSAWSRVGQLLTILDPDGLFLADDEFSTAYAYDAAGSAIYSDPSPGGGGTILAFKASGWKWKQIARTDATDYSATAYDDSAWATAAAAFGDGGDMADDSGGAHTTLWQKATRMWARRTLTGLAVGDDINVTLRVDESVTVWLNGTQVLNTSPNGVQTTAVIDGANVTSSSMVLAVRVTDNSSTHGCYFDMELVQ